MTREDRKTKLSALEGALGDIPVIAYVTSTRDNIDTQMATDVIMPIYRHLQAIGKQEEIALFIHSNGGDGIVPWRLVTLIREFANRFTVLVPNSAYSAATLTALGADRVIMHPMGVLGPTDPTITTPFNPTHPSNPAQPLGISVEDVASYIELVREDVGIHHEDELIQAFNTLSDKVHPLALGSVKRSTQQSRMMGEKLLSVRTVDGLQKHEIDEVVHKLTSELFFHGHPISRKEARDELGLSFVVDASPEVEEAMWALFSEYYDSMDLGVPFQPVLQATQMAQLAVPGPIEVAPGQFAQSPPNQATFELPQMRVVYVESVARCDVSTVTWEAALQRDASGAYQANFTMTQQGWVTE